MCLQIESPFVNNNCICCEHQRPSFYLQEQSFYILVYPLKLHNFNKKHIKKKAINYDKPKDYSQNLRI